MDSISKLRNESLQKRKHLSDQERKKSHQLASHLLISLIEKLNPKTVALYLSTPHELSTSSTLTQLLTKKIQVALPILHPFQPNALLFQRFQNHTPTIVNKFKIQEPQLNCLDVMPIEKIELFILPLAAFDTQGNRIGMGSGYYDRALARWKENKSVHIGLAYECQKVSQISPQPWDVPLHYVVTPQSIYDCNPVHI